MTFDEILAQVIELLQRQGRVSYRALKLRFDLDDEYLDTLKEEILYVHESDVQADERGFTWAGDTVSDSTPTYTLSTHTQEKASAPTTESERAPLSYTPRHLAEKILTSRSALEGERKQVTVLFCDLADSTPIAERIGPENMHTLLNRFFQMEKTLNAMSKPRTLNRKTDCRFEGTGGAVRRYRPFILCSTKLQPDGFPWPACG